MIFEWWVAGDTISPGTSDKRFQCRVQQAPIRHGSSGWIYRVKLNDDRDGAFLPTQYLQPGTPWGKLFSQYEEASEQSGSTNYAMPQELTNRLSRYRKHYKVTGDVATDGVLAVKMVNSKGKTFDTWIGYAEAVYWSQWYKELERGYWYSRSTDRTIGANGRPIYSGPGVQQQLEDSHKEYYSVFTARLLEEYLMDIFYSRTAPGSSARKIKAYTGEYGMLQFHKAVTDIAQNSGFITVNNEFLNKTKSPYHSNALSYGGQFTHYKMANGTEVELVHNPMYDDQTINFEIDPITGKPVESLRYTFLDFSGQGGDSNMKLIHKKEGYKHWYVGGGQTPYGPNSNNGIGSHSGDYYEIHLLKQCGVHIHDVTRCGELVLKRQRTSF